MPQEQDIIAEAQTILVRTKAIADDMTKAIAQALKELREQTEMQRRFFMQALVNAKQELKAMPDGWEDDPGDQSTVMDDAASGGSRYSTRYRNDTLRASLGQPVSDPPIHRLEWIARATAYDPATITEENPTGDEWANELWSPVAHGEAEL
jgi:hypothetical protein